MKTLVFISKRQNRICLLTKHASKAEDCGGGTIYRPLDLNCRPGTNTAGPNSDCRSQSGSTVGKVVGKRAVKDEHRPFDRRPSKERFQTFLKLNKTEGASAFGP